jgi:cytidine deaminase
MRKIEVRSVFSEFDSPADLPAEDRALVELAKHAALRAYAPYSKFKVGAALLLDNGKTVTGNNQENMAYPSGLCAERVAAFSASAEYPGVTMRAIAIVCSWEGSDDSDALTPCGSCRQALVEYEHLYNSNIRIILTNGTGRVLIAESVRSLLPLAFRVDKLKGRR